VLPLGCLPLWENVVPKGNQRLENAEGHQTRSRRRPSGLRPNASAFFDMSEGVTLIIVEILNRENY
jgi:hypothetical protein